MPTVKTKKRTRRLKIKYPRFKDIQLGELLISPTCGCLLFHGNRIINAISFDRREYIGVYTTLYDAGRGLGGTGTIIPKSCPNTLKNRRRADSILRKAVKSLGARIKRDRTIVVTD